LATAGAEAGTLPSLNAVLMERRRRPHVATARRLLRLHGPGVPMPTSLQSSSPGPASAGPSTPQFGSPAPARRDTMLVLRRQQQAVAALPYQPAASLIVTGTRSPYRPPAHVQMPAPSHAASDKGARGGLHSSVDVPANVLGPRYHGGQLAHAHGRGPAGCLQWPRRVREPGRRHGPGGHAVWGPSSARQHPPLLLRGDDRRCRQRRRHWRGHGRGGRAHLLPRPPRLGAWLVRHSWRRRCQGRPGAEAGTLTDIGRG
jgi:hypothetical protein